MSEKDTDSNLVAGVPLVVITGLSGAGKSTAMRALEDLGCYCLDNLPPALVEDFYSLYERSGTENRGVVIACDVRSGALFDDVADMVGALGESDIEHEILFLDCATDELINRYKEVRRVHPLQEGRSVLEAIEEERQRLEPVRALSSRIIDTTRRDAAGLRQELIHALTGEDAGNAVRVDVMSFGFKYGVPRGADYVFDLRFLSNPFYIPGLKPKTGEDDAVYEYVMSSPLADSFYDKVVAMIESTLEAFVGVGKMHMTLAVGCTGGRHRSVAFARRLKNHFSAGGRGSRVLHRDLHRPQK